MANVQASYNAGMGSVSGTLTHEQTVQRESFLNNSSTTVITYGGTAQDGITLSNSQQTAANLQAWRDSVPDKPTLVEFAESGSLIPIWELCSTEQRANELKNAFEEYSKDNTNKLIFPKIVAVVYEHDNKIGESRTFDTSQLGNHSSMGAIGFNDKISSLEVTAGYRVIAYEHANFNGRWMVFDGGYWHSLGGTWINGKISSLIIEEAKESNMVVAEIFEDANYKGRAQQLLLGNYPNMDNLHVRNDKASSIKVKPGYKVLAYEHANYGGKCVEYTTNTSYVGSSFNDKISSLTVVKIN
jgi:hypothetical protein